MQVLSGINNTSGSTTSVPMSSRVKSKQRTRVPVDVQPKNLSARFNDQKWQLYAKQGLAAEGYDPEALSQDFTADDSDDPHLRAIIEQLSADYDSIEQRRSLMPKPG